MRSPKLQAAVGAVISRSQAALASGGMSSIVSYSRSTETSSVATRRDAVPLDRFDRGEPVQPAGEPRDLAVMAEGGIDETRRA